MRKRFFYAICVMAVATMVAIVSCKKDEQGTTPTGRVASAADYAPGRIDDMNAYLKDFKGRMRNPSRDENTMLSLEEAAWHLSSVANYDFGNASAEFTDIRFDTLHCQVNVTDGMVSMADLGAAYAQAADAIDEFYHSLTLENKHFRYIDATVSEEGTVSMAMMMTYDSPYHLWIPSDTVWCEMYFDENTSYPVFGFGMTELERVLNIIHGHPYVGGGGDGNVGRTYYVFSKRETPYFRDHIDPYGSLSYLNSRIFATNGYFDVSFGYDELCYYLSSYHALGHELITPGLQGSEEIVHWDINYRIDGKDLYIPQVAFHELIITYGRLVMGPGGFDY